MKIQERFIYLLSHHESGEVSVRWMRFGVLLLLMAVSVFVLSSLSSKIFGGSFRPLPALATIILIAMVWSTGLYFAKRSAEKKPVWQVSTRAMLAGLTGFTVFIALLSWERESDLRQQVASAKLESQLLSMIGDQGRVSIHSNPAALSIFGSLRSDFNDQDLQEMLNLIKSYQYDLPVTYLDFSGTQVTDHGVAQLVEMDSLEHLEHLFLDSTLVTDGTIDVVQGLENLWMFSAKNTAVTGERLLKLKQSNIRINN